MDPPIRRHADDPAPAGHMDLPIGRCDGEGQGASGISVILRETVKAPIVGRGTQQGCPHTGWEGSGELCSWCSQQSGRRLRAVGKTDLWEAECSSSRRRKQANTEHDHRDHRHEEACNGMAKGPARPERREDGCSGRRTTLECRATSIVPRTGQCSRVGGFKAPVVPILLLDRRWVLEVVTHWFPS